MRGFFLGRFQPFHLGHWELLKLALAFPGITKVIVAIANIEQVRAAANPFTFPERVEMIRENIVTLNSDDQNKIHLVPLPYVSVPSQFAPSILAQYGPLDLLVSNNDWVRAQFQNFSNIRLLPKFFFRRDQYRGGRIRELMAKGDENWKDAVASPVAQYLSPLVEKIFAEVKRNSDVPELLNQVNSSMIGSFEGEVVSGTGVAAGYVRTPHFFQGLTDFLGTEPFLGTLNIRLLSGSNRFFTYLHSRKPLRIPPQHVGTVSYWNVDCYPAILQSKRDNGKLCYVLALDFVSQKSDETIVELVAHPHLRNLLGLKDRDFVVIRIL